MYSKIRVICATRSLEIYHLIRTRESGSNMTHPWSQSISSISLRRASSSASLSKLIWTSMGISCCLQVVGPTTQTMCTSTHSSCMIQRQRRQMTTFRRLGGPRQPEMTSPSKSKKESKIYSRNTVK